MGRSGYTDDCEFLALWRHNVDAALAGKRGQKFLRDLIAALEAMPEKRLIPEYLRIKDGTPGWDRGGVCALGCVAEARGLDVSDVAPEDHEHIGTLLDIAPCLVAEVENENDNCADDLSDEERYEAMLKWAKENLKETPHAAR